MKLIAYLICLGVALACLSGCGGSGNVSTIDGTFTGRTSDGLEDVVIVASPPISGSKRTIRAYVTDGASISEFFSGAANGNIFDFVTASGEITGTLDNFGATGSFIFGNEPAVDFTASFADAPAGLYTVTVDMVQGTVSGDSTDGSSLDGTIGTTLIGNSFTVDGTVKPIGAGSSPSSGLITSDSDGQQFWIVMPDLSVSGGPVPGGGSGFVTNNN